MPGEIDIYKNASRVGRAQGIDFKEGTGVGLTVAKDIGNSQIDVTVNATYSRADLRLRSQGYVSEPWPYQLFGTTATILVTQRLDGALCGLYAGDVVTGVAVGVTVNSASLTLAKVALYDTAGNLLASSANTAANYDAAANTRATLAFSTPYTVVTTGSYYACILTVGTTPPTITRGSNNGSNDRISSSYFYPNVAQTGQADLPNPATFAQQAIAYWIGLY